MSTIPLHFQGACAIARRIASRELSAAEVRAHFERRIEEHNPAINAVVVRIAPDAPSRPGPLAGVPITIKECFDYPGTPSTFGYPERLAHRAERPAEAVARLMNAGAVVIGKTNVPKDLSDWQSHNAHYGVTRNPWNLGRTPGGSSGGAAAALAAGMTALELGSDIGGSIRMPAHCCGVYGHKPTFGIVPLTGHSTTPIPVPSDILVAGPLARTAEDLEVALGLTAGADGPRARGWQLKLPAAKPLERVAVITNDREFPVDRATERAANAVADALARAGVGVTRDPPLPIPSRAYYELYLGLLRAATSGRRSFDEIRALEPAARAKDPADRGYEALMLRSLTQSHRQWLAHEEARARLRAGWEEFFARYDAVITPVCPTAAFPHDFTTPRHLQTLDVDGTPRPMADTYFWIGIAALAYLPATTIPAGKSAEGLPIGLQILGPEYGDLTCIALAGLLEREYGGFTPVTPL